MLNEERIKVMVKLAAYESKEGAEDFKISSYYKKDYVSIHRWYTIIWVTAAYLMMTVLGILVFVDQILEGLTVTKLIFLAALILAGYVIMLILYAVAAGKVYRKKHTQARQRVKNYSHNLLVLGKLYEKEKL